MCLILNCFILTLILLSCGEPDDSDSLERPGVRDTFLEDFPVAQASGNEINFVQMSVSHQQDLRKDMDFLRKLSFRQDQETPVMMSLLEISQLNSASLLTWLESRVNYLVGGDSFQQPVHAIFPTSREYTEVIYENEDNQGDEVTQVGSNIGAGLYNWNRKQVLANGNDFFLRVNVGDSWVSIANPRVGILHLTNYLFEISDYFQTEFPQSDLGSVMRLSTLFHEARHSDGNAKNGSLGFFHEQCPAHHDFAGEYACDSNANGPYTVDAYLVRILGNTCQDCGMQVTEVLAAIYLDSLSRVIDSETVLDSQPEPPLNIVGASGFATN